MRANSNPWRDSPLVTAPMFAVAQSRDVNRGYQSSTVSRPGSQRGAQEPLVVAAHAVSIAVYDASSDRRRLLAATLYGLGCRVVPLDCASDAPEFLRAQLVASRPDVVIWQLGSAPPDQWPSLLAVLESGTLAAIGVVVTTLFPAQAAEMLGSHVPMVMVLATPFSLVDMMRAVIAAPQGREAPAYA